MKLTVVAASMSRPSLLITRIGRPIFRSADRSTGTLTYTSRVSFCSIVVSFVCDDTCIPTRAGTSPTMPEVGAVMA